MGFTHDLLGSKGLGSYSQHSLCGRLRLPPLHRYCCPGLASNDIHISKVLGSLLQLECTSTTASPGLSSRTLTLPHGIKPEDTASPIAVQSTKSQRLSTPLHSFKTTLVTLTITKSSLDTLATSISVG